MSQEGDQRSNLGDLRPFYAFSVLPRPGPGGQNPPSLDLLLHGLAHKSVAPAPPNQRNDLPFQLLRQFIVELFLFQRLGLQKYCRFLHRLRTARGKTLIAIHAGLPSVRCLCSHRYGRNAAQSRIQQVNPYSVSRLPSASR